MTKIKGAIEVEICDGYVDNLGASIKSKANGVALTFADLEAYVQERIHQHGTETLRSSLANKKRFIQDLSHTIEFEDKKENHE